MIYLLHSKVCTEAHNLPERKMNNHIFELKCNKANFDYIPEWNQFCSHFSFHEEPREALKQKKYWKLFSHFKFIHEKVTALTII